MRKWQKRIIIELNRAISFRYMIGANCMNHVKEKIDETRGGEP